MDTIYACCAGLDVHKKTVEATVRRLQGQRCHAETRCFGTMTGDLLKLSDWLTAEGVTHVAMESTGVLWKPVFNILEGSCEVLLVNARHVKQVPGRKTDVPDSQWLAQLLQHGLLQGSFIPPRPIRELRDLTRQRSQLVSEQGRITNRIEKTLEDANIKLGAVASDILGVSGRDMLKALIEGQQDPAQLADMARGRMRRKIPQLRAALDGCITEHHRFMLKLLWDHLQHVESLIARFNDKIEELMRPFDSAIRRLDDIPGIDRRTAEVIIAETGGDMAVFPTAERLASWAGMCPGNNESAGKRKSGKTTKGSRWLRAALTQAAWGASHTKNTYLALHFKRIAKRRGKKRALVAVAHSILIIAHHILADDNMQYHDLGADYFSTANANRLGRYHTKQLEKLGYKVELERPAA